MKQITWRQAEDIAHKAALKAIGFGPTTGTITVSAAEVIVVAARAAVIAMREAGALEHNDKRERALNDAHALNAQRREDRFNGKA